MSIENRIFEHSVLVRIASSNFGGVKVSKPVTNEIVDTHEVKRGSIKVMVNIIPEEYRREIRKPVTHARNFMKKLCVPWTEASIDRNSKKTGHSWYLCMQDREEELQERFNQYKEVWLQETGRLFDNWEHIRAMAPHNLKIAFEENHFPPLQEVRDAYRFEYEPAFLYGEKGLADPNDIRLKASESLIQRCAESARRAGTMKIANAICSVAQDVQEFAEEVSDQMEYDPDPKDGRKGNTLPKAPKWRRLSRLVDRVEGMNQVFEDDALSDAVYEMRNLEDRIRNIGSADDVRKLLKNDERERDRFKEIMDDIGRAVLPALHRHDGLG